jgi:NAD(P)-dependent dehydrogenase (short-subunit alcohol dehydrogenase family)
MSHIFDLTGKVAAIVGGASGIGEAVTLGAVRLGARVVCLDLNEAAAFTVAARASAEGTCDAAALDIRDAAAVDRSFDDIRARHGSLDIVICTPSINVRKRILEYRPEDFDRVVDLNLRGNFNVLRSAGRSMIAAKRGSIVLFSSIRSQVVERAIANHRECRARTQIA